MNKILLIFMVLILTGCSGNKLSCTFNDLDYDIYFNNDLMSELVFETVFDYDSVDNANEAYEEALKYYDLFLKTNYNDVEFYVKKSSLVNINTYYVSVMTSEQLNNFPYIKDAITMSLKEYKNYAKQQDISCK